MSNKALLLMSSLFLFIFVATSAEASLPPKNVFFGTAQSNDSTTSTAFTDLVPTPALTFTTTGSSTLIVQFFGSARLSAVGDGMSIRAVVDGHPLNPSNGMRFAGTSLTTISYAGTRSNVGPGQHTVTLQWAVTGGTGLMSNRTFIVWVLPQ